MSTSLRTLILATCFLSVGMLMVSPPVLAQCNVRPPVQPNDVVVGTLSFGDCTINELFNDGDPSLVDLYSLNLPGPGTLTVRMDSNDFDALLGVFDPTLTTLYAGDDDSGGNFNALLSVSLDAGNYVVLANSAFSQADTGAYTLTTSCSGCTADLAAAVLPTSRSVQVSDTATAFATVINTLSTTANSCGISPPSGFPASFSYQTTNPATNALTGTPNTPVNIAPGGLQTYLFAFTPTSAFSPMDVELTFDCSNTSPAPVMVGLNTLLLSASDTPVPDIVALAATPTNDGIVSLQGATGSNAFAVSTVNVGSAGTITATPELSTTLPVALSICETNPVSGACVSAAGSNASSSVAGGATPTYSVFVAGAGSVPFDPANNRIVIKFRDASGVVRGSTSVAVRTL